MTNDCKTCPVSTGTHQPAEALHQIAEPDAQHLQELAAYRFTVENLRARVAELEERLEIDHRHPYDGIAARDATIKALEERIAELEAERDEADRRAGRAERHMAGLNDDVRRFEAARRRMKAQWGVHDNVSFDVVWQQALDAKASQAQRVPLSDEQITDIWMQPIANGVTASEWRRSIARAIEAAHGITQEKQG